MKYRATVERYLALVSRWSDARNQEDRERFYWTAHGMWVAVLWMAHDTPSSELCALCSRMEDLLCAMHSIEVPVYMSDAFASYR